MIGIIARQKQSILTLAFTSSRRVPIYAIQSCKLSIKNDTIAVTVPTDLQPSLSTSTSASVSSLKSKGTNPFVKRIKIYADLSKFRLSSLVVLTSGAGFVCTGLPINWSTMAAATIGTALCAASAGTFNQVIERHHDSKMKRTSRRPLPSGDVGVVEASSFGFATGAAGVGMLYALTNPVVAALGLGNIFLYAGPYTYLKQHSELNTWVGSIVGAIPPVMGWAAATSGSIVAPEPAALAAILFFWQFPHFFALSWMHRDDYAKGGFQMVAVNDATGSRSANFIMEYSLYLTTIPVITSATGITSWMFSVEGTIANLYLLYLARKFQNDHSNANARRIFLCSLWYLPLLLGTFVFHAKVWDENDNRYATSNSSSSSNNSTMDDGAAEIVAHTKDKLRGLCVHEMIVNNNSSSGSDGSNSKCIKTTVDKAMSMDVIDDEVTK